MLLNRHRTTDNAPRHAYFVGAARDLCPVYQTLHWNGLSDKRWNCGANSVWRLSIERMFRAAVATVVHESWVTTGGSVRGTAAVLTVLDNKQTNVYCTLAAKVWMKTTTQLRHNTQLLHITQRTHSYWKWFTQSKNNKGVSIVSSPCIDWTLPSRTEPICQFDFTSLQFTPLSGRRYSLVLSFRILLVSTPEILPKNATLGDCVSTF